MNFIDYCIKTKNYSAIKAVNDYTKTFASPFVDWEEVINDTNLNKMPGYREASSGKKLLDPGSILKGQSVGDGKYKYEDMPTEWQNKLKSRVRSNWGLK